MDQILPDWFTKLLLPQISKGISILDAVIEEQVCTSGVFHKENVPVVGVIQEVIVFELVFILDPITYKVPTPMLKDVPNKTRDDKIGPMVDTTGVLGIIEATTT